jgi:hypothetical protein
MRKKTLLSNESLYSVVIYYIKIFELQRENKSVYLFIIVISFRKKEFHLFSNLFFSDMTIGIRISDFVSYEIRTFV